MGQIFDPTTTQTVGGVECRKPFTNNQVPIGRSQVALKVLALIPLPNYTGAGTTNYQYVTNEKVNQTVYSLRLDQSFGTRHHLFGFASARENYDSGVADLPGPVNSGSQLQDFYAKLIRVGYDFTITPRLVNQITFGGNRINSYNSAPASLLGVNYDAQLGIPNTPSAGTTFPSFNIGENLPGLGSSNYDDNVDNALLADDNLSFTKGRHSIRVGEPLTGGSSSATRTTGQPRATSTSRARKLPAPTAERRNSRVVMALQASCWARRQPRDVRCRSTSHAGSRTTMRRTRRTTGRCART